MRSSGSRRGGIEWCTRRCGSAAPTGPGRVATAIGAQLSESLRLRQGDQRRSLYRTPLGRRGDVLAFGDMVIGDAHRCFGAASAG
jgi:hypothetical protein